jgi:hypothetical protein
MTCVSDRPVNLTSESHPVKADTSKATGLLFNITVISVWAYRAQCSQTYGFKLVRYSGGVLLRRCTSQA